MQINYYKCFSNREVTFIHDINKIFMTYSIGGKKRSKLHLTKKNTFDIS